MREELKPYLDMANGLTEITRQRATEVAKVLIAQGMALSAKGGAPDKDVRDVADEVLSSVKANRDFLLELVQTEVAKATGAMGFVHTDELDSLRRHIERLERQVTTVKAQVAELAKATETDSPKPKVSKKTESKKKPAKASE
jgi:polyhydroxyalkanoate synthesis regulator phasin